ncbi:hypothetical protein [Nocardiopsis sp. LOL_012]|uniref:hypothetical protein n=1 Tax=Nocardiopsis sp. LOL_012 TaxID=3345409 RepID=UPI003A875904
MSEKWDDGGGRPVTSDGHGPVAAAGAEDDGRLQRKGGPGFKGFLASGPEPTVLEEAGSVDRGRGIEWPDGA